MTTSVPSTGMSLLLALRDHALNEAELLEAEAAALEARASEKRNEARGHREAHAAAAPYFPPAKGER